MPDPPNLMRRATDRGFYGGQPIEAGTVFNLLNIHHHQARWMEEVPADTTPDIIVTTLSQHKPPAD